MRKYVDEDVCVCGLRLYVYVCVLWRERAILWAGSLLGGGGEEGLTGTGAEIGRAGGVGSGGGGGGGGPSAAAAAAGSERISPVAAWRALNVNNHQLCYWPTIHNLTERSVLNFKFSLVTFLSSIS